MEYQVLLCILGLNILQCTVQKPMYTVPCKKFNNRFLRERGMVSNPKMEYLVLLCIFQKNSAMATLGLKEMGKFLWEGRGKGLTWWLSRFNKTKLLRTIAKFVWKMQRKVWYYGKWVGRHASFPPRRSVKKKEKNI